MRSTILFMPTVKENPGDTTSKSLDLLTRGSFVYQTASGLYSFAPLRYRVISNIKDVICKNLEDANAQEILLPELQPAELWKETGRWDEYGPQMFIVEDRDGREYCLNPTSEEAVSDLVRSKVRSQRQLPIILYQFGNKFRDETVRQRLIRTREFCMKDAYSFNIAEDDLDNTYDLMRTIYTSIFRELNLNFKAISADPGEMGGSGSEEFIAISDLGTDRFMTKKLMHNLRIFIRLIIFFPWS